MSPGSTHAPFRSILSPGRIAGPEEMLCILVERPGEIEAVNDTPRICLETQRHAALLHLSGLADPCIIETQVMLSLRGKI